MLNWKKTATLNASNVALKAKLEENYGSKCQTEDVMALNSRNERQL